MFNKTSDVKPKIAEQCCEGESLNKLCRRPTIKEEAEAIIDRHLNHIEHSRKLIKFTECYPDAVKYLEENNFQIYGGL